MADRLTIANRTSEEIEKVVEKILLDIYAEFIYNQRDTHMWMAGMDTMAKIKP